MRRRGRSRAREHHRVWLPLACLSSALLRRTTYAHNLHEDERASDVVVVVQQRLLRRLAHGLEAGKVDHAAHVVLLKRASVSVGSCGPGRGGASGG